MKKIIIIGSGGHAKVVADIILAREKELNEDLKIIGFLDDNFKNLKYDNIFNIPILGELNNIDNFSNNEDYFFIIAIGSNEVRKKISRKYKELNYYTAIHPRSVISREVTIGSGTVVMANVVINSNSTIGKHCILNTSSVVEHDNKLGDYVHISPNATLCGGVNIENNSWIGAGSVVRQQIHIGKDVVVGANSIVVENIEDSCIVVGNPAKKIKEKEKK
ncbi:acetyltransferase [Fusobacterium nucleatum]|uniref:acetyltransferase n=1 Tax=Fusobacterium nucleatum TaxID=851 RepID=UPI0030D032EC